MNDFVKTELFNLLINFSPKITNHEMQFAYEGDPEAQVISTSVWQVYQVAAVSTQISLKLRALSDCPNTNIPPRAYYAPEFTSVNS